MKNIYWEIIVAVIVILLVGFSYNFLINSLNYPSYWFAKVNSLSTALAAIGGLCLLIITFLYLLETRKMVQEMQRQREPAVTIRFSPDKHTNHLINIVLKNTGGGPAYDISVNFDPDLPYRQKKSLNELNVFKRLPLLEIGESYEFFFDSAADYLPSNNPKRTIATITYFKSPQDSNPDQQSVRRSIKIDFRRKEGAIICRSQGFT